MEDISNNTSEKTSVEKVYRTHPKYPGLKTAPKWLPGESGNPKGRPPASYYIDRLLPADKRAERLVSLALQDQHLPVALNALKESYDRTDGPVKQQIEVKKTQLTIDFEYLAEKLELLDSAENREHLMELLSGTEESSNDNDKLEGND